jgi:hypothetical protein
MGGTTRCLSCAAGVIHPPTDACDRPGNAPETPSGAPGSDPALNGIPQVAAEAPSPEAASLARLERDVKLIRHDIGLLKMAVSMQLALAGGHQIDRDQLNTLIVALGGQMSAIARIG